MADIAGTVIGAVACVTQCLSSPVGRRFKLTREFKTNFENLKIEIQKLREKSMGIQRDVDVAGKNGDRIQENVQRWLKEEKEIQEKFQKWLERASKITGDDKAAGEIREAEETAAAAATGENREDAETAEAKKHCFKGLCPDLKMRYKLSKDAETLQKEVVKHLEDGKFDKISDPVIPKDLRLLNTDYRAVQSRTSTLKNVISSLSDPNVNIVGIYGMGGVGKTTLAREVANRPETSKLFDSVIFVEVTVKPDIMKIQQEIAGRLPHFTLSHEETMSGRADKLHRRLESEKKIIIILDNVWAEINLLEIGIPLGDGRKLLLTARSVDVLEKMNPLHNFPVDLLDDEEAWQLFKNMSRDNIEGGEFESVARAVAKKCARLPILIVTVARALKKKNLYEWEEASGEMGLSYSPDIERLHKSIELSFKYLENEALMETILLIRYANMTSIDELLLYGMCLGIFKRVNNMKARRRRLLTLVQQLKDSCLLLDSNTTGEDFSMHDIVRDVALEISTRGGLVFTNEQIDELDWPDDNTLKVCHSVVLKDVKMDELPQVLECQQLKLLSVSGVSVSGVSSFSSRLHDEFFLRMTQLKVLVLNRLDLRPLSPSLSCLTNLQALGLYDCQLYDIAIIGYLKKLEILSLKESMINELPVEIGHLARLKSFDLRGCSGLLFIPPNVISSLSHLEELYMGEFDRWDCGLDRKCVSVDELRNLSNLTCLQILITDAKTLSKDLSFKQLERYKIEIGPSSERYLDWGQMDESCRKFKLSLAKTNICLKDGYIMQLKGIEDLRLAGSQDMKSIVYELDRDGFPQLKYLQVVDNEKILCMVDSKKDATPTVFPLLESLSIKNLYKLENICHQITTESSFSKLKQIEVGGCNKLENLFSFSIARRLQLLQSIDIYGCQDMKEIFSIEREDESSSNISEVIDNIELSQLRSLRLRSLPQLKSLDYNSNGSNTLFSGKVVLPNLEVLELGPIYLERIWQNSVAAISSGIQNLTELSLRNCYNLKCLFSSSMIESFDRLQYLEINNCPSLEEIMVIDDEDELRKEERKNNVAFSISNINSYLKMRVSTCHKLKTLFPWNIYKKFLRLESLSVSYCNLLEVVFDLEDVDFEDKHSSIVIAQLSKLKISGLPKLKQVWNKDPKKFVSLEKLKEMTIRGCHVLTNVFPASVARSLSQSLERLEISGCDEIVSVVEEKAEINSRFVFPRLISLELDELPKFRAFIFGIYTRECSTSSMFEKVFPKLEELILEGKSISIIWEFPEDFICKLKYLEINFDESIVVSSLDFLQRFHSIRGIQIYGERDWEQVEMYQNESWGNIRYLNKCFNLKCILKEESNMDHLVYLKVQDCANLVNLLVPSSTSFRNLTTLDVRYCKGLTNIVTSSTVKTMVQLTKMTIGECNMILELVLADEGDEKDNEIVFRELKELYLFDLQSLTCFCSANYILKFPSLEELSVRKCLKMKSFSRGKLSTPKLQKVKYWREEQFEECWKEDLNTTIKQLHEEMCERLGQIMLELTYEEKEEVSEDEKATAINSDE